ncbi:MAG: hypothetical protein M3416_02170 [Acidobacteriota bacterium]|nr:hypothetical protein [Acidobacteriota bacterium]
MAEREGRDGPERDMGEHPGRELEAGLADHETEGAQGRQRERVSADETRGGPSVADNPAAYLLSEDSPLLLINIPEYVTDPGPAIEAIRARVYGTGGGVRDRSERLFDERGKALYAPKPPSHVDAETLMLRLRTFVALDSQKIKWLSQHYGTRGRPREYYSLLASPDRPLSNREIKRPLVRLFAEELPLCRAMANIHRDTGHPHPHTWVSALQINNLKLHVGREKVDGRWVDRFNELGEKYVGYYAEQVGDPSLLEEYRAKKEEWNAKKARAQAALAKGERPPAMPFRARHLYDELGERRQRKERRGREANGGELEPRRRAAPVARRRSKWECAELWGKTFHAEARLRDVSFRLRALETAPQHAEVEVEGRQRSLHRIAVERRLLERQRDGKEDARRAEERERREAELRALEARVREEVEARRQLLLQELEEAELSHEQHRAAWEKTVENRREAGLSTIEHPLHNTRQLEEMRNIAERTLDATLLRHVHEYELVDRPAERDALRREFAEGWGREVMAQVAVHEQELRLRTAPQDGRLSEADAQARPAPSGRETEARMYCRLFDEWASGGWSSQDMRRSLQCVRDERLRHHAKTYLRAREYHEATKEVLRDYRAGAEGVAAPPALSAGDVGRIRTLLSAEGAVRDEQARAHLQAVSDFASGERRPTNREVARMSQRSLQAYDAPPLTETRGISAPDKPDATRPFDEQWVARLPNIVVLAETRSLAAGMREVSPERLDLARQEAVERREALEFARWVRDGAGLAEPPTARVPLAERTESANLQRFVSQQLVREPRWTSEQITHIREFSHRAPEKDREKLFAVLDTAEQSLERARVERIRKLTDEKIAKLNEAITRADGQYSAEVFTRLDLDQLREPQKVREESERLARQYLDAVKGQGLRPEQIRFSEGSAHERAKRTVAETIETAERLRAAWVLAAADSPSVERLQRRLDKAGIEVEVAGGDGRAAPAIRLKLGDVSINTRTLERGIDVSEILSGKHEAEGSRKARTIEKCVQMALLSPEERDRRISVLHNQSGPRSLAREEERHRSEYARLAVAAVRRGAAPNWRAIDNRIEGMPAPPGSTRGNTWLVETRGVTRLSEPPRTVQTVTPVRLVRELIPVRNPTRPSHEPGRTTPSRPRSGGGSRGR